MMVVLEEFDHELLNFGESKWIATLREAGHDLLNVSPGGSRTGAPPGYWKRPQDSIDRMVAARRAKHDGGWGEYSAEARRKMSQGSYLGHKFESGHKHNVGSKRTPEQKARIAEGQRAAWARRKSLG